MPETLAELGWLAAFVADLRRRGITFVVDGQRLKIRPWREVTDAEAATIQANREALKALIRAEPPAAAAPVESLPPASPPAVVIDADAALKERDLESWRLNHRNDPEEIERRRSEATAVMMRTAGRPHPWDR